MSPSPFLAAVAVTLLILPCACKSTSERWAELAFEDVSYPNLRAVVVDVLDSEGFPVMMLNPASKTIESDWVYGTAGGSIRAPNRRKALVEMVPIDDLISVRVRVQEEILRTGTFLTARVRESDDWEAVEDNFDDAEFLAAKLRALLIDSHVDMRPSVEVEPGS